MSKEISVSVPGERETPDTNMARKSKRASRRPKLTLLLCVLIVLLISMSIVLFLKYRHASSDNQANKQQRLTRQLGQLIVLPPEQPVISTVLDKSKLTNPALEQRARNGDVLFIFPHAKRLILYRPSNDRVVDILSIQS